MTKIKARNTVAVTAVLVACLAARGQTVTVVVNPMDVPAHSNPGIGDDLTDVFLGALKQTRTFNVIDGRVGREADPDFHLDSSLGFGRERIADCLEKRIPECLEKKIETVNRISVEFDLRAADSKGRVFFTDHDRHTKYSEADRTWKQALGLSNRNEVTANTLRDVGRSTLYNLARRLAAYFDIMGSRAMSVESVKGRVVSVADATTAVVDVGIADGIRPGDQVEVQRSQTVTNADGIVIFSRTENIGRAEVAEVQDRGALITAEVPLGFEEGDTVVRTVPELAASEYVEAGNALMEAAFFERALEECLTALRCDPGRSDVLFNLGLAQMTTGDPDAADESVAAYFNAGLAVQFAATHGHAFWRGCEGTFVLTRQSISYRSPREDAPDHWFDVPLEAVVRASYDGPGTLVVRAPSAAQVEKKRGQSKKWALSFDRPAVYEVAKILARYISGP